MPLHSYTFHRDGYTRQHHGYMRIYTIEIHSESMLLTSVFSNAPQNGSLTDVTGSFFNESDASNLVSRTLFQSKEKQPCDSQEDWDGGGEKITSCSSWVGCVNISQCLANLVIFLGSQLGGSWLQEEIFWSIFCLISCSRQIGYYETLNRVDEILEYLYTVFLYVGTYAMQVTRACLLSAYRPVLLMRAFPCRIEQQLIINQEQAYASLQSETRATFFTGIKSTDIYILKFIKQSSWKQN
jgi:hypothetical protein